MSSAPNPAPETGWRHWVTVGPADVERITGKLFLTLGDRSRNFSAFWILLVLAAVIASAGVVADSTATVIGAMIVAPLMTPILGTALALVLADRSQVRSGMVLVVAGAASVIAVGFLLGVVIQTDVTAANNSQVAARVSPRLIDLLAALATGLVGAFALLRDDVSDTLPGVAIAISLVPPLAVVGLTLEAGAYSQAWGALLLFGTNVAAIIATGTALLLVGEVRRAARSAGVHVGELGRRSMVTVAVGLVVVAVPLGAGSWRVLQEQLVLVEAKPVATEWADAVDWEVTDLSVRDGELYVTAIGLPPEASEQDLRDALDQAGLEKTDLVVKLELGTSRTVEGD